MVKFTQRLWEMQHHSLEQNLGCIEPQIDVRGNAH